MIFIKTDLTDFVAIMNLNTYEQYVLLAPITTDCHLISDFFN